MPYNNPFRYSDDNLRYHSYNYYLKHKYQHKVTKVPLDAGFSCPNRDGSKGFGGCIFCSARGSGDFIEDQSLSLEEQFDQGLKIMQKKWPDALAIAYFQAYSNTHSDLDHLKEIFDPFSQREDIVELSISTRPDCLDEKKIAYLSELNQRKPITIELGLQSIHEKTMSQMNRLHDLDCLKEIHILLKKEGIRTTLHIINGLPDENMNMMIETAKEVAKIKPDGIKIHMLNILSDAPLYKQYLKAPFELLTKEEYVDIVVKQLEVLPPEMVIERLTGDGLSEKLIAPLWIKKKTIVLNEISKCQKERNTYQGKYYETGKY